MATHPNILVRRILQTKEPGGLQAKGSQSHAPLKRLSTHTYRQVACAGLSHSVVYDTLQPYGL